MTDHTKPQLALPWLSIWLLRIVRSAQCRELLEHDVLKFCAFYLLAKPLFEYPPQIAEALDRIETTPDSPELLSLARALEPSFPGLSLGELAEAYAEGRNLRRVLRDGNVSLLDCVSRSLRSSEPQDEAGLLRTMALRSDQCANIAMLARHLELCALQEQLLNFAFSAQYVGQLAPAFGVIAANRREAAIFWPAVFGSTLSQLREALGPSSRLVQSGLLQPESASNALVRVSRFWAERLGQRYENEDEFFRTLLEPFEPVKKSAGVARVAHEAQRETFERLLARIGQTGAGEGLSVLVWGPASVDKERLVHSALERAGLLGWRIRDDPLAQQSDYCALTMAAQHYLRCAGHRQVLITTQATQALAPSFRGLAALFYLADSRVRDEREETSERDRRMIEDSGMATLWLVSDLQRLPEDTVGRMHFHLEVTKGTRIERAAEVARILGQAPVSEQTREALLKEHNLSSGQVHAALKLWGVLGGDPDEVIRAGINASQRALGRVDREAFRSSITHYSLEYLNTTGRFGPAQLLTSLRKRPRASVCLYGLPGTGKTQLVTHIAQELGKPLIARQASELLSKWLGEAEKNISEMFAQAEAEDAVLLLDEADSFLRDRRLAEHQWEVSQVNELLQAMERFEGVFFCATNLFERLDAAALRRFTFKIGFQALSLEQRWSMFLNESGLLASQLSPAETEQWQMALAELRDLTPGDFATVKRQATLLDVRLSPQDWLEQLRAETAVKRRVD